MLPHSERSAAISVSNHGVNQLISLCVFGAEGKAPMRGKDTEDGAAGTPVILPLHIYTPRQKSSLSYSTSQALRLW